MRRKERDAGCMRPPFPQKPSQSVQTRERQNENYAYRMLLRFCSGGGIGTPALPCHCC